jgi:hypothetical protein
MCCCRLQQQKRARREHRTAARVCHWIAGPAMNDRPVVAPWRYACTNNPPRTKAEQFGHVSDYTNKAGVNEFHQSFMVIN